MNVVGKFRKGGEGLDKIIPKSDWVGGGKAKPFQAIDLVHRLEQLDERTLTIHLCKFVTPEQIHDLAEEGHFLDASRDERAHLAHDFFDRATSFGAARLG